MVTRSVVQSAMHTAATALAQLPSEQWAGWVAYLCECLEDAARAQGQEHDYDAVMQKVADAVQERADRGEW
jgi:hypothetical protein